MHHLTGRERFWFTTISAAGAATLFAGVIGLVNPISRWILVHANLWRSAAYHSSYVTLTGTVFALGFLFFFLYCPVVTLQTLWNRLWFPEWATDMSAQAYEEALTTLLAMVPSDTAAITAAHRQQLVRVLKAFETEVVRLLGGPEARKTYRLLWIVRADDRSHAPQTWAQRADRLTALEQAVVNQCFQLHGWFIVLPRVARDHAFAGLPPDGITGVITARNPQDWSIGFVIAMHHSIHLAPVHLDRLKAHMLSLMPLWELDRLRAIMVQLQRDDWEVT